ncbi:prolipoprotein diacylglyceryl transferase [Arcobacter sp. FWKO B]|uniref:prolipoprotein diacylglyceryl transferase n=1 Tax=Arcobacter sp. FWKO B TaxID=2593672 RepID=UPI0018A67C37|nr:prolipoprotein diacylglyceryl transferase [Arcobacter sp. FWKO B]QOG11437.1 prolipoprotein diacylglyceryl transferase [Arcobacter sp. FWKO B]
MNNWQNIYNTFDPVAFHIGSLPVFWYGIMYATALIIAILVAKYIVKKDKLPIKEDIFDGYIWWAEIGVILGARLGYIIIYDKNTWYYMTHPWQIFNPFIDGMYAGISGMSYHGAIIGFVIATYLYCKKHKISFWYMSDIAVIAIPLGYIFGRIGNFLNQELIGRATDMPWGIYVGSILRHPSQLYEAILEGLFVFIILYWYRNRKKFNGELTLLYGILYSIGRIIAEFYREPDFHIGFIMNTKWLTMGMITSFIVLVLAIVLYVVISKRIVSRKS